MFNQIKLCLILLGGLSGVISRFSVVAWSSVCGGRVNWSLSGVVSRGRIEPAIMNNTLVKMYQINLSKTDLYLGASVV